MKQTVCITGGSEGLGLALAKEFAKDGHTLILVARRMEKLIDAKAEIQEMYDVKVDVVAMDLANDDSAIKLFTWINEHGYVVDILVNNAGIGYAGESVSIPYEKDNVLMKLNMITPVQLCKLFANQMVQRGSGEMINIASTSAYTPGPYMNVYYASKAFLLRFTEALHYEMKHTPVKVYCYMPGPIDTLFYVKSSSKMTFGAISPEKAARYVYTHRKSHVVIMRMRDRILQWFPKRLRTKFIAHNKKR